MDMRVNLEKLRDGLASRRAGVDRRFVVLRRPETATSRAATKKLTRPLVDRDAAADAAPDAARNR